jgi:hypothetical protein
VRALVLRTLAVVLPGLVLLELAVRLLVSLPAVQAVLSGPFAPPGVRMLRPPIGPACESGSQSSTVAHDPELGWGPWPGRRVFDTFSQEVVPPGVRVTGVTAAPGARRVALVGDSFTFGHDVDDADTWAAGLARRRPDLEILNFGVDGYGHDQAWLRTRRDVLPTRPSVVVLGFVHVDVLRNGLERFRRLRPVVGPGDGGLVVTGVPVPTAAEDCARLAWTPWSWLVARMLLEAPVEARLEAAVPLTRAILDALASDVRAAGAELVVVELPELAGLPPQPGAPDRLAPPYLDFPADHPGFPLAAWCAGSGVACLDAREAFDGVQDVGALFLPGHHPTPAGHDRIAAWLAERLAPTP